MNASLETRLADRQRCGNLRELRSVNNLIDFASNDYLGLARSEKLKHAVLQEWNNHSSQLNGLGATGSRLLTGNTEYAEELEERIAQFHGYEAGLLFGCGYMANIGLVSAIANSNDTIFYDAHIHASMRDGIRLSRARALPFRHNDLQHLEKRLKGSPNNGKRFICIDSIYSIDGTQAPLREISELSNTYNAYLIVDEAHALGVFGPQGSGLVAEQQLTDQVFAQITTFGKGLGTYGAIVLGSKLLKSMLINFSKPYIYTTAMPMHHLAAIKCAYEMLPFLDKERLYLHELMGLFKAELNSRSNSPIQPILIRGNSQVRQASEFLASEGFDVRPLMSPTVQRGNELLRVCLHAFNTKPQLLDMINRIKKIKLNKTG